MLSVPGTQQWVKHTNDPTLLKFTFWWALRPQVCLFLGTHLAENLISQVCSTAVLTNCEVKSPLILCVWFHCTHKDVTFGKLDSTGYRYPINDTCAITCQTFTHDRHHSSITTLVLISLDVASEYTPTQHWVASIPGQIRDRKPIHYFSLRRSLIHFTERL